MLMGSMHWWFTSFFVAFISLCSLCDSKSASENLRTLCFHTFGAEERGTDVAIYDYADFSEALLGYKSLILLPDIPSAHNGLGLAKYKKRFGDQVVYFKPDIFLKENNQSDILTGESFPGEAKRLGCDFVYILKSGELHSVPYYPEAFNSS